MPRKQERPNYRKHRSQNRRGWNHLECSTCEQLKRNIKMSDDDATRLKHTDDLNDRIQKARLARKAYYATRAKAVGNVSKGDCSMIIDAGGGDGCTYVPRYTTQEKHEPKRHKMFKIKTTFIKVHGVGSLAVISFPLLEKQGGNLTFECVSRGIVFFLRETKNSRVRNLHVQLDNVFSNKNYTLAAAFAALIYLGVCKKVKVSYLEVKEINYILVCLIFLFHRWVIPMKILIN